MQILCQSNFFLTCHVKGFLQVNFLVKSGFHYGFVIRLTSFSFVIRLASFNFQSNYSVMAIVVGNGHGDTSSNSGRD